MAAEPPFFLVWREDGDAPVFQHQSMAGAEAEADRLARLRPGYRFFVLVPTSAHRRADIDRERFEVAIGDGIPF